MVPTASQWQDLWYVCAEIDVWPWPATLGDMAVIDGLSWITELQAGTRSVASRGQLDGSPPGFEEKLMRLHRALQAMTAWPGASRGSWRTG